MSYPSMSDKTTRRMVASKICNDSCNHHGSNQIVNDLYDSGMLYDTRELETVRSILDRRITEYNRSHDMSLGQLISNIKRDIAYFWGKF